MDQPTASHPERRLDSWKEIAAFFGRDERTVRRWESDSNLPVRRVPGVARGRVFAYESELQQWLRKPAAIPEAVAVPEPSIEPIPVSRKQFGSIGKWAVMFSLAAALLVGVFAYRGDHHFAVNASTPARTMKQAATPEAQDLYLKGRYYWSKRTPEDLNKAVDFFTQSIVHDPGYASAYVGLADSYNLLREYSAMPASEAYPRALAAAKKAVELDDGSSEAHASLAFVSFFGMWDVATGEREFHRAIELDPKNPAPHHWWANGLLVLHRFPEALAQIDWAQRLDPSSSAILADKGNILYVAGHREEALSLLKAIEARDPYFRSPHLYLKYAYFRQQDYPAFLSESRKDAMLVHDAAELATVDAAEKGFAARGASGMLEAMLKAENGLYAQSSVTPTAVAWTLACLGDKSEALRYLNFAFEQRDSALLFLESYPEFDNLHHEPAYQDLLARMKLPPQLAP